MSEKRNLELGFRVVGVFWDNSTYTEVRNALEKEYPEKKYRKRIQLIEVLDESKIPQNPTLIITGAFRCQKCGLIAKVDQVGSPTLKVPTKCSNCGSKSFSLDVKKSEFWTPKRQPKKK